MNISFAGTLLTFLYICPTLYSAVRPELRRNTVQKEQSTSDQSQIIVVPVTMTEQPINPPQQDTEFFNTLLSIASHFGNILIDPNNSQSVVYNVGNMIQGIIQAAQIITKYQKRAPSLEELSRIIAYALQKQIEQQHVIIKE